MKTLAQRERGGSAPRAWTPTLKTSETAADRRGGNCVGSTFDNVLEQRISRIIAKRRVETLSINLKGDDSSHGRQTAHNILVVELIRFSEKVATAVADLNSRTCNTDIWLRVDRIEHTLTSAKVYNISLAASDEIDTSLVMTVDWTGNLRVMLKSHKVITLLDSRTVFSVSIKDITEMLVTLLECHYH
jgi:hypothetical protein